MSEIVEPFSKEYLKAATFKKIPLEALKKLPSPIHLIKITPQHINFLHSALTKVALCLIFSDLIIPSLETIVNKIVLAEGDTANTFSIAICWASEYMFSFLAIFPLMDDFQASYNV